MTQLLHIIGPQGSGKTALASLIVRGLGARPGGCVYAEEALNLSNNDIRNTWASDALVVVEAEERGPRHVDLHPGDWIVTLERRAA